MDDHATHFQLPHIEGALTQVHTSPDAEGDGMNLEAQLETLKATVVAAGLIR